MRADCRESGLSFGELVFWTKDYLGYLGWFLRLHTRAAVFGMAASEGSWRQSLGPICVATFRCLWEWCVSPGCIGVCRGGLREWSASSQLSWRLQRKCLLQNDPRRRKYIGICRRGVCVSSKSDLPECPVRVIYKSVTWARPTNQSSKSALQECQCPTRVLNMSVPTRVSSKKCPVRAAYKRDQKCEETVSSQSAK